MGLGRRTTAFAVAAAVVLLGRPEAVAAGLYDNAEDEVIHRTTIFDSHVQTTLMQKPLPVCLANPPQRLQPGSSRQPFVCADSVRGSPRLGSLVHVPPRASCD